MTTGPETGAAAVASVLRERRAAAGLKRGQVADLSGIHVSMISRLERGRYQHQLTEATVATLSRVLDCGAALYHAAGMPTPQAARLAADPELLRAFDDGPLARAAIRNLHLAHLAGSLSAQALSGDGRRVDEKKLWRVVNGSAAPGRALQGAASAQGRFDVAHRVAHLVLRSGCQWPRVVPAEQEAHDLAAMLLCPGPQVKQAIRAAFAEPRNLWSPDAGRLVESIADFLVVPGWTVLRCIGPSSDLHFYLVQEGQDV